MADHALPRPKTISRPCFHLKEPGSAITHLIGALLSVFATPFLLIWAAGKGATTLQMAAFSVFLLSMTALYSASTAYHSFHLPNGRNRILKKLDHMMIFVLIAGTYTPICLTVLAGYGGVYEYLCSVFTELVFGTVFWDYSWMPLNIGGRTNVLYCIFWGLLAVVWVKILCPPMERQIEKIPALPGKILTWIMVVLMLCNSLLTGAAMLRYTGRQIRPEPSNIVEAMLDAGFDDAYMEHRWPNMVVK